jgi:hypothetical protein
MRAAYSQEELDEWFSKPYGAFTKEELSATALAVIEARSLTTVVVAIQEQYALDWLGWEFGGDADGIEAYIRRRAEEGVTPLFAITSALEAITFCVAPKYLEEAFALLPERLVRAALIGALAVSLHNQLPLVHLAAQLLSDLIPPGDLRRAVHQAHTFTLTHEVRGAFEAMAILKLTSPTTPEFWDAERSSLYRRSDAEQLARELFSLAKVYNGPGGRIVYLTGGAPVRRDRNTKLNRLVAEERPGGIRRSLVDLLTPPSDIRSDTRTRLVHLGDLAGMSGPQIRDLWAQYGVTPVTDSDDPDERARRQELLIRRRLGLPPRGGPGAGSGA